MYLIVNLIYVHVNFSHPNSLSLLHTTTDGTREHIGTNTHTLTHFLTHRLSACRGIRLTAGISIRDDGHRKQAQKQWKKGSASALRRRFFSVFATVSFVFLLCVHYAPEDASCSLFVPADGTS